MADESKIATPAGHRTVRSFVKRGGRTTVAQQRALDELLPRFGLPYGTTRLDLDAAFGRAAPRMLEIGFGAGEALLAFAQNHPEFDCLGIEVHPPGVGHLLLGIEAASLTNVRVICHDAVEVLREQIGSGALDLVHIFFADPWPKKRHHKRRIIQPAFVALLANRMKSGATLRLATDWQPYALHIREVLDASAEFTNAGTQDGYAVRAIERPLTKFERRGQRLGHDVWDMEYRKR